MVGRTPGVLLDGSEGSMIELAESLSLQRFIDRHNDPDDPYHLDPHEVVCCSFQFKNGVSVYAFYDAEYAHEYGV